MAESFNFDFFQIPQTGLPEPDIAAQTRTDSKVAIRRAANMKLSNFGALNVGARMGTDYTRVDLGFKAKGESEDWSKITEDTGIGQNVGLFKVSVNHNPYLAGSSVKFTRDDQFIRMTMSKDNGDSIDLPKSDVMDAKASTAEGIVASGNAALKNWPSEGWRSFGGKYDFLPYSGGMLK